MSFAASIKQGVVRLIGNQNARAVCNLRDFIRYFLARRPPVLVYQMGKVGSQSVYYSLRETGYFPILHFHYVSLLKEYNRYEHHYVQYLLKRNQPVKIISLVRDPVARNLSAFAHDFKGYFGGRMQDHSLDKLESLFWQYDRHSLGVNWFDEEFLETIGVDVYQYNFAKERGYQQIREGTLEILILQVEVPDQIKRGVISKFCNVPGFELRRYNLASARDYKGNYDAFVDRITLPEEYLDQLYNSRFTHHFYSQRKIDTFKRKWLE